ncbi:nucleotidyltransferase domain-containing protein [candidate division KSB1 bacterium]|nr:MAG: nucleotidyltransferase domain-containing protein [candidate division KSB1 bacterium]
MIEKMVKKIVKYYKPEKIILFGSYAYGASDSDSDVDLLIIKDVDLPRYQRGKYIRKFLTEFRFPKDIIIYTPEEVKKWEDCPLAFITYIMKKGIILYEKN